MRCLVVHAHPDPASFSAALVATVCGALEAGGHDIRLLDLYAIDFDPVMRQAERVAYHTPGINERPVADHIAHLRWAEALVFVYPTWWYGLPAILKGWLDRAFVPGVAFTMPEGMKPIGPGLPHIRLLIGVSTYGAPWWFTRFWVGDPGRRTLQRGLKPLFARRCRSFWLGHYRMDASTPASRAWFLEQVARRLRHV